MVEFFGDSGFSLLCKLNPLGRVVQTAISANPGLKFNPLFISTSLPTKRVQQNSFLYPPQPRKRFSARIVRSSLGKRSLTQDATCGIW